MICSDIWHKCHGWYFEIVITQFHEPLSEWNLISQVVFMPNITTNHAIICLSTKVRNFHMYKAFQINVSVNSSCTHLLLPPPGYCGAFARLSSPRGGAFANFALPGDRAFANPGAIPELLTRTKFPIKISLHRGYYWKKKKQIGSSVKDIRL